jgi:cell wall-associated NlpC family hydrolase
VLAAAPAAVATGAATAKTHAVADSPFAATTSLAAAATLPTKSELRKAERRVAGFRARKRGRTALRAAMTRIGRPYSMGAMGPQAFDCSGLTSWSMRRAGIRLPRTSFAQARIGSRVARSNLRPGDLVFFNTAGPGASHVGIATGRNSVVSATSRGVMEHSISDSYWGGHYVGARRVAAHR